MIYLETSAVVKLVRREPESNALADWLDTRLPTRWVTSTLTEIELPRSLRRTNPELLTRVPAIIARVGRYEIDEVVLAAAAAYPDSSLRSLDAIHLATADVVFGRLLTGFVSYDARLRVAAAAINLPIHTPGR